MKLEKTLLRDTQYSNADGYRARLAPMEYADKKFNLWEWTASHYDFSGINALLEVGCGTGDFWNYAQQKAESLHNITLTDFSEGMLNTSKETLKHSPLLSKIHFELADVEELKFADNTFDAVLAHLMLYHPKSQEKALHEISRVLRKNGFAGMTTFNLDSQREFFELTHRINSQFPPYAVTLEPFNEKRADALLPQYFKSIQKYSDKVVTRIPHVEVLTKMIRLHPVSQQLNVGEDFYHAFQLEVEKIIAEKGFFEMTYMPVMYVCGVN